MQTRRSASPDDGFWPVESETRTNRYRYSPTNPAGGMVERPTGRTRRTLQGEWSRDQQAAPDEPGRGNGRTPNRSHPTNPAGRVPERPTGRTRRTLQGEWSSAHQAPPEKPPPALGESGRPKIGNSRSGCPDLNWGPLRPERSALPSCATPRNQAQVSHRAHGHRDLRNGTTSCTP